MVSESFLGASPVEPVQPVGGLFHRYFKLSLLLLLLLLYFFFCTNLSPFEWRFAAACVQIQ